MSSYEQFAEKHAQLCEIDKHWHSLYFIAYLELNFLFLKISLQSVVATIKLSKATYSRGPLLSNDYLMSPTKTRLFWESKIYPWKQKYYQPLQLLIHFGKGFRSFHAGNVGSVGQRAAKLLAVKIGVLKKKSATLAITAKACASAFSPSSSLPGFE